MTTFLTQLAVLSLSGGAVIALLLALAPLYKKSFSGTPLYYLWLVPLARLLVPFTPYLGLPNPFASSDPLVRQDLPSVVSPIATLPSASGLSGGSLPSAGSDFIASAPSHSVFSSPNPMLVLFAIWLFTALALFAWRFIGYAAFSRRLSRSAFAVTDPALLALYERAADDLGLGKRPVLLSSAAVVSPMLIGLLRPAVVLSERCLALDGKSLSLALRHELTHYRRRDLWYKWLWELAVCIHWFNPLAHLAAKRVSLYCELSCDEEATRSLDRTERLAYGDMLLAVASGQTARTTGGLSLSEEKKGLRTRLGALARPASRKKGFLLSGLAAALLLTLSVALGSCTAVPPEEGQNLPGASGPSTSDSTASGSGASQSSSSASSDKSELPLVTGEALAKLADGSLTVSSLEESYRHVETGSGLYILSFPVAEHDGLVLLAGFYSPGGELLYLKLSFTDTDLSADLTSENLALALKGGKDELEALAVRSVVESFGKTLRFVSLLAPEDDLKKQIQDYYGSYVDPALLQSWLDDLSSAPGRAVSSPWPDRIEISSLTREADGGYAVTGELVEASSTGDDGRRPVALRLTKSGDRFLITAFDLGAEAN